LLMLASVVFAQDTTGLSSTGNILNLGGGLPWSNTVQGQALGYSGGYIPAYNPSTGNIIFGYTTQTVSQTVAINQALANAGTGIQLAGYAYSWGINNDLNNSGGNRGTVTGKVSLNNPNGIPIESYNYNYSNVNTGGNFQTFSGTQLFTTQYQTSQVSSISVSFTGKDQNYWAGFYGPRVHVNSFDLLYTVNPCTTNPAYSPTCAGFSNIVTSSNLVPNPNAVSNGNIIYNSFAVNTALKNSGSGVEVYGFNYGFNYSLGSGTYGCTATNQDGSCSWYMTTNPSATVKVILQGSTNNQIYSASNSFSTPNTSGSPSYQFLLPSTTNSLSLGNFNFAAQTSGDATVSNMYATALYKPDPCVVDPLSSTSCPGYGAAYAKQQALAATTAPASTTSTVSVVNPVTVIAPAVVTNMVATNSGSNTVSDTNPVTTSATSSAPIGSVSVSPTVVSAPAPSISSSSPATTTTASTSSTSSTTSSGNSNKESSGTSIGLAVVAKNQQQTQATAMSAAANATAAAQQAGTQAQQTALSVAATAVANSTTASQQAVKSGPSLSGPVSGSSTSNSNNSNGQGMLGGATTVSAMGPSSVSSQKQDQSGSSSSSGQSMNSQMTNNVLQSTTGSSVTTVAMIAPTPTQTSTASVASVNNTQQNTQSVTIQESFTTNNVLQQQYTTTNSLYSLLPPVQPVIQTYTPPVVSYEVAIATPSPTYYQSQQSTTQSTGAIQLQQPTPALDRFSPINQATDNKVAMPTTNAVVETGPVVNKNAQNNEAAGKVDINKMATAPSGYGNYLTLTLKDAAFYAPKEVYKNQKNVDNARAFRSLASDSKHQQLVDLQYK